jgi:nicotinamide-nucleotide amidase
VAGFPDPLRSEAQSLLQLLRGQRLKVATAESCTGGLIAALLTELPGSSDVFERGFVTYSNAAKTQMIGVDPGLIAAHGAVSHEVALAMAAGAIKHSLADVSIAVTGMAGPGGGSPTKPVGLVHIAAARQGAASLHRECRFGNIGRSEVRLKAVANALTLVTQLVGSKP